MKKSLASLAGFAGALMLAIPAYAMTVPAAATVAPAGAPGVETVQYYGGYHGYHHRYWHRHYYHHRHARVRIGPVVIR